MRRYFPAFRFNATTTDEQRVTVRAAEDARACAHGWTADKVAAVCRAANVSANLYDAAGFRVGHVDSSGKVLL
jgi:hypothetical protein